MGTLSIGDHTLIRRIGTRYHRLANTPTGLTMLNLTAYHISVEPLKLEELLNAEDSDLYFEVTRINDYIDHGAHAHSNSVLCSNSVLRYSK